MVHQAQNIEVVRNAEALLRIAVDQSDRMVPATLVRLDQHQQFAENPGEISPVDLIDDEDERCVRLLLGPLAELEEHPVPQSEAAFFVRSPALDEVLVGV